MNPPNVAVQGKVSSKDGVGLGTDVNTVELPEPKLADNARIVLERRYLKKNEEGQPVEELSLIHI